MAIRQRGGRWQVDVKVGKERVRASAPTEAEAIKLEAQIRAKLLGGEAWDGNESSPNAVRTLRFLLDHTWTHKWKSLRSGKSRHTSASVCVEILGEGTDVRKVTAESFDTIRETLASRGNSNATINRKTTALGAMLNEAAKRRWIDHKPYCAHMPENKGRIRYLSEDEEVDLLSYVRWMGADEYADLYAVAIDTGCRVGELFSLTVRDVDTRLKLLAIWQNKTDHPRSVPLSARSCAILKARCNNKRPRDRVFPGIRKRQINTVWDRARGHMGLDDDPQFVPHAMRHTCASRLAQAGVPLQTIKEWMGHLAYATTLRYAHLAPGNLSSAAAQVQRFRQEGHKARQEQDEDES